MFELSTKWTSCQSELILELNILWSFIEQSNRVPIKIKKLYIEIHLVIIKLLKYVNVVYHKTIFY